MKVQKRVRQRCNLSPTLFNLYIKQSPKDLRFEDKGGMKIGKMLVQIPWFADDIFMIAEKKWWNT